MGRTNPIPKDTQSPKVNPINYYYIGEHIIREKQAYLPEHRVTPKLEPSTVLEGAVKHIKVLLNYFLWARH
jgi:hypothetical protein